MRRHVKSYSNIQIKNQPSYKLTLSDVITFIVLAPLFKQLPLSHYLQLVPTVRPRKKDPPHLPRGAQHRPAVRAPQPATRVGRPVDDEVMAEPPAHQGLPAEVPGSAPLLAVEGAAQKCTPNCKVGTQAKGV